ncbi:unnamed protein product, partial [Closterium sp. NIES-54]
RAAPHSSFPPTTAPLQTLHMDMWGPARVSGQGRERYFLLVVDDYTCYTTLFPLRSKCAVPDVLIPWICAVCLQLREPFREDLPVLRLHSDRGGEFSSDLLRDFCRGEGILQTFNLPASPQKNGIADRHIGLVMEVDPLPGTVSVQVAVGSGAARGAASGGAASGGAEPGGAESEGPGSGGAEPRGAEPWGAEPAGLEPGSADLRVWSRGVLSRRERILGLAELETLPLETLELKVLELLVLEVLELLVELVVQGVLQLLVLEVLVPGVQELPGLEVLGALELEELQLETLRSLEVLKLELLALELEALVPGGAGARGAGAGGGVSSGTDAGGTVRPRPYFVPLLQQVLSLPSSAGLTRPLLCPPPDQSQPPLQPASPLLASSPYTEQTGGLTDCREPESRPASPVCAVRTCRRVPRPRPPPVPNTHAMALRPSSVPLLVPLLPPPRSSLPAGPDLESDLPRAASPTVSRLLATVVTDPSFESTAASALIAELVDVAAACRLYYATAHVAEFESANALSVEGECTLGTDVLEDRKEDLKCLAAAVPRFASMLLAPEGDPDAPDISTPRSYAEAITSPHSSQWQAAMDAEMASWKSTGTYVHVVPPPGANIVDGMWIFRVKRPPGSPPVFKERYVARGFNQRQGVDYFQTFSPTPKMTTLRSAVASALVAELVDFAAACRLDYDTALVAESESACPPSVGGECALGTDVLEDRQEEFECLAAAVPRFASMLLAPDGDPDAPDILPPRSYAEAITGPYSSQWEAAMDAEMASWKSTGPTMIFF